MSVNELELGVTVDLGCGFDPDSGHASTREAVGLDLNFHLGQVMVDHPVMSDVTSIPLRDHVADRLIANAILEHLEKTSLCLDEMKRIMRTNGSGSILIPLNAYQPPQIFRRFIKEFPFSLGWVLSKLWRTLNLWKIPGMLHVTQVEVSDIDRWFKVDHANIVRLERLHKWFVHAAPMTILIKLGLLKRRLAVPEYVELVIPFTWRS